MKNEIGILLGLELRNLYGINVFRHTKDKKVKRNYILLSAVWLLLILMVCGYAGGLVYGLVLLGMEQVILSYLIVVASLLLLAFDIFKAGSVVFSGKGYDILCAMPVKQSSIVAGRFLAMYVEDLLLTLLILIPGVAVYAVLCAPGPAFYVAAFVGILFAPMLPLVVATAIGALITAVSSKMKHKTLMQSILTVGMVVVILVFSMNSANYENLTPEKMEELANLVSEVICGIYSPAVWVAEAATEGSFLKLLAFVAVSVLAMTAMLFVVGRNFHAICIRLSETSAKHDYRMEALKSSNLLTALFKREMKRYFASSIYVTNTIIGPIMATLMAVALFTTGGIESLRQTMPLPIDISVLLPFVVSGVFTMMTTTAVSISMEGKEWWIIKTLPVSAKALFDAKILLNLVLMLPFYIVTELLLLLSVKPDFLGALCLILVPAVSGVFAVVFGITVNLRFHSFDWAREEAVVKQSAAAAFGGFAGMLLMMLCLLPVVLVPPVFSKPVTLLLCLMIALLTGCFYQKNNRARLELL